MVEDRKRKDEIMGKTVMGAAVSLDGFIADDNDGVGPLFDWYGHGDVAWAFEGADEECRTTEVSADFMQSQYRDLAAVVIGRRLFDLTNGWNGKPPSMLRTPGRGPDARTRRGEGQGPSWRRRP